MNHETGLVFQVPGFRFQEAMLDKLLRLSKEEGGKVFFIDKDSEEVYCLLTLEAYEKMKMKTGTARTEVAALSRYDDLSEDELLDKMQAEIATWRNRQKEIKSNADLVLSRTDVPPTAKPVEKTKPNLEEEEHFFLEMA